MSSRRIEEIISYIRRRVWGGTAVSEGVGVRIELSIALGMFLRVPMSGGGVGVVVSLTLPAREWLVLLDTGLGIVVVFPSKIDAKVGLA